MLFALLFFLASVVFGYSAARFIGFCKTREEELFSSFALGLPLASVVAYAGFFVFGGSAHYAALVLLPILSIVLLKSKGEAKLAWDTGFWFRMAPVLFFITVIFIGGAVHTNKSGNYEVSGIFWQDAYYHVSIEKYFAYNQNVPPQDPQYAGVPLNYPFLIDLYSGVLERLGMPFALAFSLPALVMVLAFFACVYFLAMRLTRSKNAAVAAVLLLLFSGSLSYGMMLEDAGKHANAVDWLENPDRNYAVLIENPWAGHEIQFFTDHLARQRSSNFGYTVATIVFILFFEIVQKLEAKSARGRAAKKTEKPSPDVRLLAASGILTGFLPLMREVSFIACVLVGGTLFLFYRRKEWLWFFVPALVLGGLQLAAWAGPSTTSNYVSFGVGWRANSQNPVDIGVFWLKNIGIPLIFALAGFILAPKTVRKYYLAFIPIFAAVNLFQFTPDYMNNMKLVNMWQIPTYALAAAAIIKLGELRLFKSEREKTGMKGWLNCLPPLLAVAVVATAMLPGALSIEKDSMHVYSLYGKEDIEFAKDANALIPKDAVVLAFDDPHAFDLVGRVRMLGFPAVGWVKGRPDWYERATNQYDFYSGKRMNEVAKKYGLTHVSLIPSNERRFKDLNETAIRTSPLLKLIYKKTINGFDYEIYEVRKEMLG